MTGLDEAHPTRRNDERTVAGRHRMMRRADREVTDCEQIEESSPHAVSCMWAMRMPRTYDRAAEFRIRMAAGWGRRHRRRTAGLTLYIHSASIGRKLDAIRAAGNALDVAFSMETDCEVIAGRTPCNWGEAFKSVIGNGVASMIDDLDECRKGLRLLMGQQAGMPDIEFTDQQVRSVTVWKIEVRHLTAKIHAKPEPRNARRQAAGE
ncbi:MAG: pyridoxamine 5'-phosphate oxidase family protein [Bifidobacterium bifidum]